MNCTPTSLAQAAKCYCFPTDRMRAVWIYLLCQWVTVGPPPPSSKNYLTDDQGRYILDDQGHRIVINP